MNLAPAWRFQYGLARIVGSPAFHEAEAQATQSPQLVYLDARVAACRTLIEIIQCNYIYSFLIRFSS